MTKRANGAGSRIFDLPNGRKRASVTIGYRDGKQVKKWVYGSSVKEVVKKQSELLAKTEPRVLERAVTLGAWLKRFNRDHPRSKSTETNRDAYRAMLGPLLEQPLERLTALKIRDHARTLEKYSPSTRQHLHDYLNSVLRDATKTRLLERNPMDGVPRPSSGLVRPKPTPTAEQLSQYLAAVAGHSLEPLFLTMLAFGLRIGEVCALKWSDLQGERLTIPGTKTKAAHRIRYPTPDMLELFAGLPRVSDWMFPTATGTQRDTHNTRRDLARLFTDAKLETISPHAFRRAYITRALEEGIPPHLVAAMVGHTDSRLVLEVYAAVHHSSLAGHEMSLEKLLRKTPTSSQKRAKPKNARTKTRGDTRTLEQSKK